MLQHLKKINERSASLLLLLLLSADFTFIVLHVVDKTLALDSSLFIGTGSYGYLTIYQLVKLFWVIILFAYVLKATKYPGYLSWILVFACLLLDEALQIHQNIGSHIANGLGASSTNSLGLRPRHLELAVLATAGTFLLAVVAWAYLHGPDAFRKISKDMSLLLAVWAFFGVFTDLAAAAKLGPAVEFASDFVEDGGELAIVSLILWYVFLLAIRNGKPEVFLHDLLCRPLTRRCT